MTAGDALGGYLPLELPAGDSRPAWLAGAHGYQSARAAFLALLQAVRPARVWLPWYLCDSMAQPLAQAGIEARRYSLDPTWAPQDVAPADGELLLHVNHFGLLEHVQRRLADQLPPDRLVFDNSQAFYAPPLPVRASLYSPRKFFGVPDGGWLLAPGLDLPACEQDTGAVERCAHLLLRHAAGAEAGYASFTQAEATLDHQPPRRMSRLTARLLGAIDYEQVRQRRRANFEALAAELAPRNPLCWELPDHSAPLCYPFLARRGDTRARLVAQRIYTPCYWPELLDGRPLPARERTWAERLLALPVDQRYDPGQLRQALLAPLRGLLEDDRERA